jgi:predicted CoA-binding protein
MSRVAVIGASPDAERYSNKALRLLREKGHTPVPVAPKHERIEGDEVFPTLREVPGEVETVSVYVAPARQEAIIDDIIDASPRRVIFNPGTENPDAYDRIEDAGIEVVEACTLVLLKTGQF